MPKRLLHYLGIAVSLGVFVAAVWALQHMLRDLEWEDLGRQLSSIPVANVGLSLLFTTFAYLVLTIYDTTAFSYIGRHVAYGRVAFVSFLSYAFSHNLGFGGLTGGAVRYRFYSAWGVPALDIAKVILFAGAAYFLGAFAVAGGLILVNERTLAEVTDLPAWAISTVGILSLIGGCLYLLWSAAGRPIIRLRATIFPPPALRIAIAQLTVACMEWGFASAALYWLLPSQVGIDYWHFVGIYIIAYIAGMISHVPGGLGVLETVILLLLPETVPKEAVVAAMISYRAVYFVLPLLIAATLFLIFEIRVGHLQAGNLRRLLHPKQVWRDRGRSGRSPDKRS